MTGYAADMKIGEWQGIGRAREMIVRHLGELGADELAAHVTVNRDSGRQRILVATEVGLLDYSWSADTKEPDATWSLRGSLVRWASVRGLRLQMDAQFDPVPEQAQTVWRLVADDPKVELKATSAEGEPLAVPALLAFARACLSRAA
jgi:hypothetical protein